MKGMVVRIIFAVLEKLSICILDVVKMMDLENDKVSY
jgi:hypothetical protein